MTFGPCCCYEKTPQVQNQLRPVLQVQNQLKPTGALSYHWLKGAVWIWNTQWRHLHTCAQMRLIPGDNTLHTAALFPSTYLTSIAVSCWLFNLTASTLPMSALTFRNICPGRDSETYGMMSNSNTEKVTYALRSMSTRVSKGRAPLSL